jgi:hypothetical protein
LRRSINYDQALCWSENSDHSLEESENSGNALWCSTNSRKALRFSKNSENALFYSVNSGGALLLSKNARSTRKYSVASPYNITARAATRPLRPVLEPVVGVLDFFEGKLRGAYNALFKRKSA